MSNPAFYHDREKLNAKIVSLFVAASFVMTGCASHAQTSAVSIPSPSASSSERSADDIAFEEKQALRAAAQEAAIQKAAAVKAAQEAEIRAKEEARVAAELAAKKAQEAALLAEQQAQEAALVAEQQAKAEASALAEKKAQEASAATNTAVLPGESGYQWMDRMQRLYGVYAYPGTQFFVAQGTPCDHFAPTALGCTEQILDSVTHEPWHQGIKLHMPYKAIGNLYVLFHEIGHTQGIMDECQADIYSRNVTGIPGGYYCQ